MSTKFLSWLRTSIAFYCPLLKLNNMVSRGDRKIQVY